MHHASYRLIIFRTPFFTLFSDNLHGDSTYCHVEFQCKLSDKSVNNRDFLKIIKYCTLLRYLYKLGIKTEKAFILQGCTKVFLDYNW